MSLGAVLLLAALSLFIWNWSENEKAGASVEYIMPRLIEQLEIDAKSSLYPDIYNPAMREVEIDGYAYIGYLSIPSQDLELPVMSEWDYTRLKIAPCRYAGSAKTDNLVIAGHNYTRHFGPIRNLSRGDVVYFTDMDGMVSYYQVMEVETLSPASVEEMTSGGWDLTLFTCTYGGESRIAVRCSKKKMGGTVQEEF